MQVTKPAAGRLVLMCSLKGVYVMGDRERSGTSAATKQGTGFRHKPWTKHSTLDPHVLEGVL